MILAMKHLKDFQELKKQASKFTGYFSKAHLHKLNTYTYSEQRHNYMGGA